MRKVLFVFLIICSLLLLTSCSYKYLVKDSTQVQTNTSEDNLYFGKYDISNKEDEGSSVMSGINKVNEKINFFFRKLSGTRTLARMEQDTTFEYESKIESGILEVVILDSNYKLLRVLGANSSETVKLDFGETKNYIIRAVGDNAYKGNVVINIK